MRTPRGASSSGPERSQRSHEGRIRSRSRIRSHFNLSDQPQAFQRTDKRSPLTSGQSIRTAFTGPQAAERSGAACGSGATHSSAACSRPWRTYGALPAEADEAIALRHRDLEVSTDLACQQVVDLAMAGNGRRLPRSTIDVHRVPSTFAQ